jgi:hypothetical protein
MLRTLLHRAIDRFARRYRYDAGYLHEILDVSAPAFLKFALAQGMNRHRTAVPVDALFAARLAAVRHEDCGPCAQLTVDMGLDAGVAAETMRAIVARDFARMPVDVALALEFTEATLAHAPCDELRDRARERWGGEGLVTLAFAIAATRNFPTIKRVLGYAHACERLRVAGEPINVVQVAA